MTNTNLRTSHHRADCKLIPHESCDRGWWHEGADYLNTLPPADYVEEQWDGDTLVRWREIRLGADEYCDNCSGHGLMPPPHACNVCSATGVKPRDSNPEWTEVEPICDSCKHTRNGCSVCSCGCHAPVLDDYAKGLVLILRTERDKFFAEAEQWKAIATQLYDCSEHTDRCDPYLRQTDLKCPCGLREAVIAYRAALAQEGG